LAWPSQLACLPNGSLADEALDALDEEDRSASAHQIATAWGAAALAQNAPPDHLTACNDLWTKSVRTDSPNVAICSNGECGVGWD